MLLLAKNILEGNTQSLAKAITLVESKKKEHRQESYRLLEEILPHTGQSLRVGISGIPGVGKSTFIEQLGLLLISQGRRVAVLAVDPSSPFSGGAIMGDKVRMEQLSRNKNAFIRPAPAGDNLGGVGLKTRESMFLCEACGFDTILIETVGVGQSEHTVAGIVDCFILLALPHTGDEIQGIKKGILELADILVINKADGPLLEEAKKALSLYEQNLNRESFITICSSLNRESVANVLEKIQQFQSSHLKNRSKHREEWMRDLVKQFLLEKFHEKKESSPLYKTFKKKVQNGGMSPIVAAEKLVAHFYNETV